MKKLVLGSLMLVALASQTTGCIISSSGDDDPDDFATITAEWSFHTVNPTGQLSPANDCPPGFNTVALHNQELDASDRPIGPKIIDLFDCIDDRNFSDPLAPGVYETFVSVTSDGGASIYADSLAAIVDVRSADKTFVTEIVDNGGYFKIGWNLRDEVTNEPLLCGDNLDIDGIEIVATLLGPQDLVVDQFDCERGFDFSAAIMEGSYSVDVNAFMDAQPDDVLVGEPVTLTNQVMRDRNQVTDLGTVTLLVP